jgi:hypothetical protein
MSGFFFVSFYAECRAFGAYWGFDPGFCAGNKRVAGLSTENQIIPNQGKLKSIQ